MTSTWTLADEKKEEYYEKEWWNKKSTDLRASELSAKSRTQNTGAANIGPTPGEKTLHVRSPCFSTTTCVVDRCMMQSCRQTQEENRRPLVNGSTQTLCDKACRTRSNELDANGDAQFNKRRDRARRRSSTTVKTRSWDDHTATHLEWPFLRRDKQSADRGNNAACVGKVRLQ